MILISYLVDEMVSAEVRLDRMLQGGKEVKRAVNKYRKLLVETQAMKDKYTLGHYRTKAEYLMAVGHKVVRINEELRGTVEVATAENEVQEDIFEDVMEAEIMEQPDRPRLLAAGFPSRSFVDPNTPSRSRPIGMSARVQERVEVQEGSMRKKKCVSCEKKFRDGLKRKSTVLKCTSCSELTHLRCAKNAPTPFYCSKCPNPRDQIEPLVRLPSLTDPAPLPLLTSTQVLDLEGIEVDFEGVTVLDTVAPVVEPVAFVAQPVSPVVEPVSPVVEPVSPVFKRKRKATIVDSTRITRRRVMSTLIN